MKKTMHGEAIALRDRAGGWYLLTAEALVAAVATAEQQAALTLHFQDKVERTAGPYGSRARLPLQVMGVVPLPLSPPEPADTIHNAPWPGLMLQ